MIGKLKISISYTLLPLLLLCFSTSLPASVPLPAKSENELVFGFLPIISTQKLMARFGPLVDHLAASLGQPIRMETAPDYATFLQRTTEQRYDILFTAPHFYYLAEKTAGYKVIARVAENELKAIIVARKDRHISSLKDLKGKRLATPDAMALGTVLARETLARFGLRPDRDILLVQTPSHNASLLSAYNGTTDAAVLMIPPYKRTPQTMKSEMVELVTTRGVPHMPICVAKTLSSTTTGKLQQALTGLTQSTQGRKLLKHLSWPMGFVVARPVEYQDLGWAIRQLNIPVK